MSKNNWRPSASLEALQARAVVFQKVRQFFAERGVLEVDTPLLMARTGTDVELFPLELSIEGKPFYLQTSPEFAMKRLLAAYPTQPFFQICKAFRAQELGKRHNPEFMILEWYRPAWTLDDLQVEVDLLLQTVLGTPPAHTKTYAALFQETFDFCPHTVPLDTLKRVAQEAHIEVISELTREQWLDLLMSRCIEPQLGKDVPLFVREYPAKQAALARVDPHNPLVAMRFECYVRGIELANAYDELVDPKEQLRRFEQDNVERAARGLATYALDERLIEALAFLPQGSGIALGMDRLCLLALGATQLSDVMTFTWEEINY